MPKKQAIGLVQTVALYGFNGIPVQVEVDIRAGLPSLRIVGMGSKAIDESRHRVRSAILNTGLTFPTRRLVVNLSPAELPKDGTHFDLPIAMGILRASGQITKQQVKDTVFIGELSLTGELLPVRGATLITEAARELGVTRIFVPVNNYAQASLIEGIEVLAAESLQSVFWHIVGIKSVSTPIKAADKASGANSNKNLDDIAGQSSAKRALMLAVAGKHNILLHGPPGTGKTHLAKAAAQLLPPLSKDEAIEVTKIHSLARLTDAYIGKPPLREPHHSTTRAALVGGGSNPKPGEVSLAHRGVLILDELPEFSKDALEALRQPLEDKMVNLSRTHGTITYPADPLLIATMNPCPCGFYNDPDKTCSCGPGQIAAYKRKISGPLLDRIDLHVQVARSASEYIFDSKVLTKNQHTSVVESIISIRSLQHKRYKCSTLYNGNASLEIIKRNFHVKPSAREFMKEAQRTLGMSGRGILQTLRVARTIADAEESETVNAEHVAEALQYRNIN